MTDRKMEERRKGDEAEWVRGTVRKGKKRDKYRYKRPKRGERKGNMEGIDKKKKGQGESR